LWFWNKPIASFYNCFSLFKAEGYSKSELDNILDVLMRSCKSRAWDPLFRVSFFHLSRVKLLVILNVHFAQFDAGKLYLMSTHAMIVVCFQGVCYRLLLYCIGWFRNIRLLAEIHYLHIYWNTKWQHNTEHIIFTSHAPLPNHTSIIWIVQGVCKGYVKTVCIRNSAR
jgi:hypothetical protein